MEQNRATFTDRQVVNAFIVYELDSSSGDVNSNFKPGNCFFRAPKLTGNIDPDEYIYSGFNIGFDTCSEFLLLDGG